MIKVGIISFAHGHANSYANALRQLPGVDLFAITDDDPQRRREAVAHYNTTSYTSTEELLASGVDAVIVTSENVHHHRDVLAAAAAGKHVLCEKPLSTNRRDGLEMIAACQQAGVILQTAFPVRFSTPIARMKAAVDRGVIGQLLAVKATNRGTNPGGWFVDPTLSGGGAMLDHTVHVVDILRWISGAEVREVYAEVAHSRFSDIPIDDCGTLAMEFDNGLFATLDFSWSRNRTFPTWGDVTLELIGSEGSLRVDAFAQKLNVYSNDEGFKWDYWGDDMNFGLIADFIDHVRQKTPPTVTGEDGLKAAEVAFVAYESASSHQPVRLNSD